MKRLVIALVIALGLAGPVAAQQEWSDYDFQTSREAGYALLLYNEATGEYQRITLETLLAGLAEFPDGLRRYVALRENPTRPTFTAAEFSAGATVTGQLTGLAFPTVTGMPTALWLGVAVEEPGDLGGGVWFGTTPNEGFNNVTAFVAQADVTISGTTYNAFVLQSALSPLFFGAGSHIYFSQNAVNP